MLKTVLPLATLMILTACSNGGEDGVATPPRGEQQALGPITDGARGQPEATDDAARKGRWAIATANPHATDAGARILEQGGTAVDAAVAVQAVLGLVEPQSSGLGGGAFMLFYDGGTGAITAFDGRETAPLTATPELFLTDESKPMGYYDAILSGYAVGVPGAVAMLSVAHEKHGRLEWSELFTDPVRLAREGFKVSPRLETLITSRPRLAENEAAEALFFDENGQPRKAGSLYTNPDYAETVEAIANGGAAAFYSGPVAEAIVEAVNTKTGETTMTLEDLAAYEPIVREPVCGGFLTYEICSMPPPSSGGVTLLQILGVYERAVDAPAETPRDWLAYVEASRLAYADREMYLADPTAMGEGNVTARTVSEALYAPSYLDGRAGLIGDEPAASVEAGDPIALLRERRARDASADLPGTSHFSIRDSDGNIVSVTTTVESAFGSHIVAAGMVLNNQLTDFSFLPERDGVTVVNSVAAGKRPRSSMTPVIALNPDYQPVLAIGSPGGSRIIGYVAKTVIAHLAWGQDLQDAVDLANVVVPRGAVNIEEDADPALIEALEDAGYDVSERALTSGLYGFAIDPVTGALSPGVDARREGSYAQGQ